MGRKWLKAYGGSQFTNVCGASTSGNHFRLVSTDIRKIASTLQFISMLELKQ
jgi:hypothetical protein